jgi:S-adenosyl-L-methionine hydrolase (adenosine-forming)
VGTAPPGTAAGGEPAIYFLSDYGPADEFVGVVHAVLHRWAPAVPVIDLGHLVPPFDVASGAAMLVRCAPYLGGGAVLAVVDPSVGTGRRGVAVETAAAPLWLVGPDNGLLVPLAGVLGGAARAVALGPARAVPERSGAEPVGRTFDGRDLFAPAAAHLVLGRSPAVVGTEIDPASLVSLESGRLRGPPSGPGTEAGDGDPVLDTVVTWVDRYGNVQLGVGPSALTRIGVGAGTTAEVTVLGRSMPARRVDAFDDLGPGELGLVIDSTGHAALVLRQASAALRLSPVAAGDTIRIAADPEGESRR